jgi:hypothetical protein
VDDDIQVFLNGTLAKDAEFIAHARSDVPVLVAAVEAVLELHQRNRYDECIECLSTDEYGEATNVDYPCPTVAAIQSALGEEQ